VHVVNSSSVNSFKNNLDRLWSNQEVYYNFRCDINGIGNRRVKLIRNCIEAYYEEVDTEAKPASSIPIWYDTKNGQDSLIHFHFLICPLLCAFNQSPVLHHLNVKLLFHWHHYRLSWVALHSGLAVTRNFWLSGNFLTKSICQNEISTHKLRKPRHTMHSKVVSECTVKCN